MSQFIFTLQCEDFQVSSLENRSREQVLGSAGQVSNICAYFSNAQEWDWNFLAFVIVWIKSNSLSYWKSHAQNNTRIVI